MGGGSNTIIYILHYFKIVKLSTPTYKYSEYSEYCAHLYSSKIHFNYIFNYIYKIDVTLGRRLISIILLDVNFVKCFLLKKKKIMLDKPLSQQYTVIYLLKLCLIYLTLYLKILVLVRIEC